MSKVNVGQGLAKYEQVYTSSMTWNRFLLEETLAQTSKTSFTQFNIYIKSIGLFAHAHMQHWTKETFVQEGRLILYLKPAGVVCVGVIIGVYHKGSSLRGWGSDKFYIECHWFMRICRHTHTEPHQEAFRGHNIPWIPEALKGKQR